MRVSAFYRKRETSTVSIRLLQRIMVTIDEGIQARDTGRKQIGGRLALPGRVVMG